MRRKADGTAFENEFKEAIKKEFYIRRLPTLNTGYAGQSQPADFIAVGKRFNYVEVKETKGDSFSITQMQQYEEFKDFIEERDRLCRRFTMTVFTMDYVLVVHFLSHNCYRVVYSKQMLDLVKRRKTVRWDGKEGLTFTSLNDLVGGIDL